MIVRKIIRAVHHAAHLPPMGDAVAVVAQPIAKAIDSVTSILPEGMKTDLKNCPQCPKRQAWLNELTK
jgi:hypothetical protein